MSDLTYAQALDLAQNMRNHYLAFQRLGEVLDLAATGVGQATTLRRQIDELTAQLQALRIEYNQLEASAVDARAVAASATQQAEALRSEAGKLERQVVTLQGQQQALAMYIDDAQATHHAAIEQMTADAETRRAALDADYQAHAAHAAEQHTVSKKQLQAELDQLAATRDVLANDLVAKRNELGGLQRAVDDVRKFLDNLRSAAAGERQVLP